MPPRMRTRSAGRPAAESLGGGTGERVSRGGRGRRPREGNDERVDELNGQGNGLGMGANGGVEGANGNVGGANGGAPDFPTIIAQQLRNLLPAMLAQVSNQGNVGNQNGNVVNENVQGNVGNVIVNGNRVGLIDLPIGGIPEDIPNIRVTTIDRMWSDHTLILLHKKIDGGSASSSNRDKRIKLLQDIEKLEALNLIQKAHIKWDIKGDENSKFFHGMINKKRRSQAITGILHDGVWILDQFLIKEDFLNYYNDKFKACDSQVVFSPMIHSTSLTSLDCASMETHILLDEIKIAV
ncbi:hypothetical protein Tco_0901691 [Tanacetum coccineum]